MKFLSLEEANERVHELTELLGKVRETRNRYSEESLALSPWAAYGKRIVEEQEKAMWDELRVKHPNIVGRAANMAAHNWHVSVFDGRVLMHSVANGGSYEITSSGYHRYEGTLPRMCVTCTHSKAIGERGAQAISCGFHTERRLKGDVCDDHEVDKC